VRGTIGGKGDTTMDATTRVNCALQPAYGLSESGSHTLRIRDRGHADAPRASRIETTVDALAEGSAPRLSSSRAWR
jgi:hypothetical protein